MLKRFLVLDIQVESIQVQRTFVADRECVNSLEYWTALTSEVRLP